MSDPVTLWTVACKAPLQISPGKNTGVGCHFLLQGIFPTQGLNLHSCIGKKMDSLPISHQGSPHVIIHLSKATYNMGSQPKCQLWTVGDYDASTQGVWEISVPVTYFCYEPKTKLLFNNNKKSSFKGSAWDFPCGLVVKNLPSTAGDLGSIPGQGSYMPWGN